MKPTELSEKESLDIIVNMINQAKANFRQSSFHLLLWGWIISIASFSHYYLMVIADVAHPEYVWLLVIPGILASIINGVRIGKKSGVSTYADRLYLMTWIGFIITLILLQVFIAEHGRKLASIILLITGYSVFMSGNILKFKPLIAGGILIWVAAIIAFLLNNEEILLVTSISIIAGYLIPGYMLKNKVKNVTF